MRRGFAGQGLIRLHMYNNPCIGDSGTIALSQALPSTLVHLGLSSIGCEDAGMLALVGELPRLTQLQELNLSHNHGVKQASWEAFAELLPQMWTMRHLNVNYNQGMGAVGMLAICAALRKCTLACPGTLRIVACCNSTTACSAARTALMQAWGLRPREELVLS